MEQSMSQARELFTAYNGNLLDMHRAGKINEYKSYEVSKETENEWFAEMVAKYTMDLSIRDWDAVTSLRLISRNYQSSEIVEKLAAFAARNLMSADSIVRCIYADQMVEIIKLHKEAITRELLLRACKGAIEIFESLSSQPLVIDPGHELGQLKLKDKRALNQRVKSSIEEVLGILNQ
ncbi:hypothetical protein [Paenibacillus sp. sgz500958]|uniref:hypothetical protein n=1 Tax=Paenibacillus sp. sgz500958 TaxID=3242475 RepID=UPI0036D409AE